MGKHGKNEKNEKNDKNEKNENYRKYGKSEDWVLFDDGKISNIRTNKYDKSPINFDDIEELEKHMEELNCGCDLSVKRPVCGTNGITYANKCLLGCAMIREEKDFFEDDHNGVCSKKKKIPDPNKKPFTVSFTPGEICYDSDLDE